MANAVNAQTVVNENGDFSDTPVGEITDSNDILNWNLAGMDHADYEIVADPNDTTNHILMVNVPVNDGTLDAWSVQAIHENISLRDDMRYSVALRVKVESESTATLQLHPQGLRASVALYGQSVEPGEWHVLETATFQPEEEEEIVVAVHFAHSDNPNNLTVNIDWIEVREFEAIPTPSWDAPMADGQDKFLGSTSAHLTHWEYYWNQLTPANAGKWGSVEGSERGERNWSSLDTKYNYAKDRGLPFRFHVLLWGSQQPSWIEDLSEEEQLEAIEDWLNAVAERYPDIDYLEVLNEQLPGHGGLPYKDALGGEGDTGWNWIITAFQMARDIFPQDTKLMINDYGVLGSITNTDRYLEIIGLLQERDLIDGIGVQGHHFTIQGGLNNPQRPVSALVESLDKLGETGLPIQITEMDIGGNPMQVEDISAEESDQTQLEDYQRIFSALWEHPSVEGITTWGFRPPGWRPDVETYLVRDDGTERPALQWLREYLAGEWSTPTSSERDHINPQEYNLSQNYPNPFNPTTSISYELPQNTHVTLEVFNMLGHQVAKLFSESQTSGQHQVSFDASNLSSGIYLYRLEAGSFTQTKKMMLIK